MTYDDLVAVVATLTDQVAALSARVAELEGAKQSQSVPPRSDPQDDQSGSLPAIDALSNVELTYFDNGPGRGRSRYKLLVEANVGAKRFCDKRDVKAYADLFDLHVFEDNLRGRSISDAYRATLQRIIKIGIDHADKIMIGMIASRGGRKGQVWHDHQFVVTYHNGDRVPVAAQIYVGPGDPLDITDWMRAQIDGKPFALSTIRGKAVAWIVDGKAVAADQTTSEK